MRIDIDLKKQRHVGQILIWQTKSTGLIMNKYDVFYSTDVDGSNWNSLLSNTKGKIADPGGLAYTLNVNVQARWIRVASKDRANHYDGSCAEIEVYDKGTTAPPTDLIAHPVDGGTKLSWSAPNGIKVQLRRKKLTFAMGSHYNWPLDQNDGLLLLESTSEREFVDTSSGVGKVWFYGVFAFDDATGWSVLRHTALDTWCAGCPNPDLAQFKRVYDINQDFNLVYGGPAGGVNGIRGQGPSSSNNARMLSDGGDGKPHNPGSSITGNGATLPHIRFGVDLKKVRKIRQVVAWQARSPSFGTNFCTRGWYWIPRLLV
jgi:hypothetical protein